MFLETILIPFKVWEEMGEAPFLLSAVLGHLECSAVLLGRLLGLEVNSAGGGSVVLAPPQA